MLRYGGALLVAAQRLGSAARAAGAAVQHAREPEQFGASFGSFRVVEHLCAGMPARAAVYGAAVTGDRAGIAAAVPPADGAAVRRTRATAPGFTGGGLHLGGRCSPPPRTLPAPGRGRGRGAGAEEAPAAVPGAARPGSGSSGAYRPGRARAGGGA
ncbi:acyl-CoA dehydrogenase family protein [Streptomyces sp. NPDC017448]|uniref:acyl-CoA dehydrogenase family protein n=1 Tax=Streptomyces sp. NPDC017448 TaxID=3364996 RepID=UPI0037A03D4A